MATAAIRPAVCRSPALLSGVSSVVVWVTIAAISLVVALYRADDLPLDRGHVEGQAPARGRLSRRRAGIE